MNNSSLSAKILELYNLVFKYMFKTFQIVGRFFLFTDSRKENLFYQDIFEEEI